MRSIPWTTKVRVLRPESAGATPTETIDRQLASYGTETGDPSTALGTPRVVATLKAHIGKPSGTVQILNGQQEEVVFHLTCEAFDIQPTDSVVDLANGVTYGVVWAAKRTEFANLAHTQADLRRSRGVA